MSFQDLWGYQFYVGSGLQIPCRVNLGGSQHGGVTVRIASGNTTKLLVSPNATTVGTSFIDVFIADGQTTYDFYIQGVQGNTGDVTLTASNAAFTNGTTTVHVVQPALYIQDLSTSTTASAADDPFYLVTGIPYYPGGGTSWWGQQPVSATSVLHVLVTSSNETVGKLRTGTYYGNAATVDVQINSYNSPSTVGAGGIAFDPLTAGTTTISATATGFLNTFPQASGVVTVSP